MEGQQIKTINQVKIVATYGRNLRLRKFLTVFLKSYLMKFMQSTLIMKRTRPLLFLTL